VGRVIAGLFRESEMDGRKVRTSQPWSCRWQPLRVKGNAPG